MVTGWLEDKGKWYFLASSGAMVTGWKKIRYSKGRAWFYFESNGAMICNALRQLKYGGEWNYYLFDKDGAMVTGKHKVVCTFSESGLQGGHL
jgi:glucan-binding YG repeat protein